MEKTDILRCSKCLRPSVTFIRYSGAHLCRQHFTEFVERRARKEMRKQCRIKRDTTISIGVSGGKDSVVALHILNKILKRRKDVSLYAVTVDEGIDGYRPESVVCASENCKELGIEQVIVKFSDMFGHTLDEILAADRYTNPCSYCGVLRRRCLNVTALELSADYLATGLNLDDTAQSILMNFVRGDLAKLARLGPHKKVQPGLVPRIQPLRLIPEKETYLYALLHGIPIHTGECPYAGTALRNQYREILSRLETKTPGTRYSILHSYDNISDVLSEIYPPAELNKCSCGEPTPGDKCKLCEMLELVNI